MQQVLLIITFRAVVLRKGTSLLPLFQEAKQRASQSSNSFAALKIMHWLAHVSRLTGQLHWAYQEGKDTQACANAARLFSLTQTEGFLQVYLNEGEAMYDLLLKLQESLQSDASDRAILPHQYIAQLLAAFEQRASAQNPKDQASLSSTFFPGVSSQVTLSTS